MSQFFIRLDATGEFRGSEHKSSLCGLGEDYGNFEEGISCYLLNEDAFSKLYDYWINIASLNEADLERGMQVTIFEGEQVDALATNNEDLAVCTKTVAEFDAKELYSKWMELKKRFDYEWENDETDANDVVEYLELHHEQLQDLVEKYINK